MLSGTREGAVWGRVQRVQFDTACKLLQTPLLLPQTLFWVQSENYASPALPLLQLELELSGPKSMLAPKTGQRRRSRREFALACACGARKRRLWHSQTAFVTRRSGVKAVKAGSGAVQQGVRLQEAQTAFVPLTNAVCDLQKRGKSGVKAVKAGAGAVQQRVRLQ